EREQRAAGERDAVAGGIRLVAVEVARMSALAGEAVGRGVALELDRNEPGAAICEVGDVERRLDVDRALQRGRDGVERAELRAGSARSLARQGIRPGRRRRRNAAARLVRRGLLCGIDGRRPPRLDVAAV